MNPLHEDKKKYPTSAARETLAARLGLNISPFSQDWEWEVAQPEKLQQWLAVYQFEPLSDGERVSLMEMLIQCVDSLARLRVVDVGVLQEWTAINDLLHANLRLHASTVEYWALLDADDDPDHQFRVTGSMRQVWAAVLSSLSEQNPTREPGPQSH